MSKIVKEYHSIKTFGILCGRFMLILYIECFPKLDNLFQYYAITSAYGFLSDSYRTRISGSVGLNKWCSGVSSWPQC